MPMMDTVTLENFRCFREKQTVRLAPLTLLVGENSTGKTSFLAMLRALTEFSFEGRVPDFKDPPYDLGSFDEIAHHRGGRGSRADSFTVGVATAVAPPRRSHASRDAKSVELEVTFRKEAHGTAPIPVRQRIATDGAWVDESIETRGSSYIARMGTTRGRWELRLPTDSRFSTDLGDFKFHVTSRLRQAQLWDDDERTPTLMPIGDSPDINEGDLEALQVFRSIGAPGRQFLRRSPFRSKSFASAPVRSHPHRTYDPGRWERDPEGDHVPMRIAELSLLQPKTWSRLKMQLEEFGKAAGLFDEIKVRHLGTTGSEPFQLQVRKWDKRLKGPFRNLLDVGYGVSQVLPIVTELMSSSVPTDFYLLQQPEVHLHPSAQAALGSLLCNIAATRRQLIVETHSDHLMDRIRMEVRDAEAGLKPAGVSLLYFERKGLGVKIHSLQFDSEGNVHPAPNERGDIPEMPDSYRRFFMEETRRSLGL